MEPVINPTIIPATIHIKITAIIGAQNGAVTHHHDQLITPHNFRVIKIRPNNAHIGTDVF